MKPKVVSWYLNFAVEKRLHMILVWVPQVTVLKGVIEEHDSEKGLDHALCYSLP